MEIEHGDFRRFAVLFLVFSGQPRIADRTQIQKLTYIVNECGWHAIEDYKFIARGPYSQWLDSQLDKWIDQGNVQENEESVLIDTDNELGFYCYSLTDKGKSLAKSVLDSVNEQELIDKTLRYLFKLSKYTEQELEIVSSILYIRRETDLDLEGIVKQTRRFRPDLREDEVRKHLDVLKHTGDNITS
ncbi:MAG: hypothetical protein ACE5KA_04310 [Nitrososphaerales archaeon]